jgi:hypothetical protein
MKELFRASVWALFIALALNVAFGQAQAWLVPYPPIPVQERAWMQIVTSREDWHNPESTTIRTTAMPTVTRLTPNVWIITFKTNNP